MRDALWSAEGSKKGIVNKLNHSIVANYRLQIYTKKELPKHQNIASLQDIRIKDTENKNVVK